MLGDEIRNALDDLSAFTERPLNKMRLALDELQRSYEIEQALRKCYQIAKDDYVDFGEVAELKNGEWIVITIDGKEAPLLNWYRKEVFPIRGGPCRIKTRSPCRQLCFTQSNSTSRP